MTIQWEGQPVAAQPGQSLAAALWAAGIRDLGGADEPARGLYCGAGHCFACRAVVDGVHGVRTCMVPARDGLRAEREPGAVRPPDDHAVPAPALDAPSSLSAKGVAGGPGAAAAMGAAAARAVAAHRPQAGQALTPASVPEGGSGPHIAILGAGPAGLAAASVLAEAGARVTVVDEAAQPGGALRLVDAERAEALAAQARDAGARILCGVSAWGVYPAWRLALASVDPGASHTPAEVAADALILATGAVQLPLALPGWTLPGVVAPWGALHLLRSGALRHGTRVAVVGLDRATLAAARLLQAAAVALVAVVPPGSSALIHPAPPGLTDGLPLVTGRAAFGFVGGRRLEAVRTGAPDGSQSEDVPADLAVAGAGLAPLTEAAQLAGLPVHRVADLVGFVPLHGPSLETALAGLYVAGGATGGEDADVAVAEGRRAATACAAAHGLLAEPETAEAAATAELAAARSRAAAADPAAGARSAEVARLWTARTLTGH